MAGGCHSFCHVGSGVYKHSGATGSDHTSNAEAVWSPGNVEAKSRSVWGSETMRGKYPAPVGLLHGTSADSY